MKYDFERGNRRYQVMAISPDHFAYEQGYRFDVITWTRVTDETWSHAGYGRYCRDTDEVMAYVNKGAL